MVNTPRLRGVIAERGFSQSDIARALHITPQAFYRKMDKGVFKTNEVETMIEVLNIENPMAIFFEKTVT